MEEDELYGIDKDYGHPNALKLIPDDFFWDCVDELAPFGSDEGDTALAEWREWRKINPNKSVLECLRWVVESVGEISFMDYNSDLIDKDKIYEQLNDEDFDQYVNTLDISVIATGFGQLADEGKIDIDVKPILQIALNRQLIICSLDESPLETNKQYSFYLNRLKEILDKA